VKNSRANPFFRASASCSKLQNDKNYIISTVNSGHPLFFRASACKLLKIPECKKYIQYSEKFQGNSVFQGKHKVAQKSWMVKNIFKTVKNFRTTLFLQGKRKLFNNRERWKNVNTVYIHLGAIRAIWASVVCNLDRSHDRLHGRNLVGNTRDVSPHFFRWGDIMCHVPPLFSLQGLYLERFQK